MYVLTHLISFSSKSHLILQIGLRMQIKWIHLHSLLMHFSFSSPVPCSIETVEDMIKMGVYVNDLNLHDSSRELILAGTQQSAELQLALDQVKPPDKERPISKADSCSTGELNLYKITDKGAVCGGSCSLIKYTVKAEVTLCDMLSTKCKQCQL